MLSVCLRRPAKFKLQKIHVVSSLSNKSDMSQADWRGSSIDELFNNGDKWANQHIPITPSSSNQTVLFHLPFFGENLPPQPQRGTDTGWDRDSVRLPCHRESFIQQADENGEKTLKSCWEQISKALTQPILNSHELEKAIKSYNLQYANVWDFVTLHEFFEQIPEEKCTEFFAKVLPKMIDLALDLPQLIQCPIPLLKQGVNRSISMSQQQAACLLANAFFCTFPYRNKFKKHSEYSSYPEINFNRLYASPGQKTIEKLKCILNYFYRILFCGMPCGVLTFFRRSKNLNIDWDNQEIPLSIVKYHISSTGKIEEAAGMLQVDFANKFIGGGVLGHGCVQEEIRFVINPELLVAKLFTECLEDNEVLLAIGCEQFSEYTGYAQTFQFAADFIDETPSDIYRRRQMRLIAIDATNYGMMRNTQFEEKSIRRELVKATIGFQSITSGDASDSSPIATGLWGCGAFNGYSIRSALIQLMACCVSQRNLTFYTFGDEAVMDEIYDVFEFLSREHVSVGKLYRALKQFQYELNSDPRNLVAFIKKHVHIVKDIESQEPPPKSPRPEQFTFDDSDQPKKMIQPKLFEFQKNYKRKTPIQIQFDKVDPPQSSTSTEEKNEYDKLKEIFNKPSKSTTADKPAPQLEIVNEKRTSSLLDCLESDYSK